MRLFLLTGVVGFFLGAGPAAQAQNEPKQLIEKAVQAAGGEEKLAKLKGYRIKAKGTLEILGMSLDFTSTGLLDLSGRIRTEVELEIMGRKFTVLQVYDGKKAWVKAMDRTMELEGDLLKEMKEQMHAGRVSFLLPLLKNDGYTLAPLGEIKVNGKPAQGVKVSAKGFRDIDLYFDQATGLLVKTAGQTLEQTTMKEVAQESVMSDFKEFDGLKQPTKVITHQDGKKFLEVEVMEYKGVAEVDNSEFAKP